MKTIKTILFTVFFLFVSILLSCMGHEADMEGCGSVDPYFEIQDLEASALKRTTGPSPWAVADRSEDVYSHLFYIGVRLVSRYYSLNRTTGGGANLYALTCPQPRHGGSKEGLDRLFVVTLNDYNENYAANDTVNDMVMYSDWYRYDEDLKPLDDYVEENKDGVKNESFLLKLAESPTEERSEQAFKIIYMLNNGARFETITYPVMIRK